VKICEAPGKLERTIGTTTRTGWRPTAMQGAFLDTLKESANDMKLSKTL
jgi:hypothetical protein